MLTIALGFQFTLASSAIFGQGIDPNNANENPQISTSLDLENRLLEFLSPTNSKKIKEAKFQLITVSPAITVTTAFGHSALRVLYGTPFDKDDFYIDFGEYDETVSFYWRFLKGEAKYFVRIHNMGEAYQVWDTTGRGMVSSEFILTDEQKLKFAEAIRRTMIDKKPGYFYDNFTSNCVTFIRDIVGEVYGHALELETDANKATWRKRLEPYALKIFWLRYEEKLLLDRDTDLIRNPTELIYLPYDLLIAVEDAKLVRPQELLHRNLWKLPESSDTLGFFVFALFVFLVASQIPGYLAQRFSKSGKSIFGFISGFSGTFTLAVLLFTSFPFMDETIMVLVFTPLDFALLSKKFLQSKLYWNYLILRLGMLGLTVILRLTAYPQQIDASLFFTILFFSLLFMHAFREKSSNKSLVTSN